MKLSSSTLCGCCFCYCYCHCWLMMLLMVSSIALVSPEVSQTTATTFTTNPYTKLNTYYETMIQNLPSSVQYLKKIHQENNNQKQINFNMQSKILDADIIDNIATVASTTATEEFTIDTSATRLRGTSEEIITKTKSLSYTPEQHSIRTTTTARRRTKEGAEINPPEYQRLNIENKKDYFPTLKDNKITTATNTNTKTTLTTTTTTTKSTITDYTNNKHNKKIKRTGNKEENNNRSHNKKNQNYNNDDNNELVNIIKSAENQQQQQQQQTLIPTTIANDNQKLINKQKLNQDMHHFKVYDIESFTTQTTATIETMHNNANNISSTRRSGRSGNGEISNNISSYRRSYKIKKNKQNKTTMNKSTSNSNTSSITTSSTTSTSDKQTMSINHIVGDTIVNERKKQATTILKDDQRIEIITGEDITRKTAVSSIAQANSDATTLNNISNSKREIHRKSMGSNIMPTSQYHYESDDNDNMNIKVTTSSFSTQTKSATATTKSMTFNFDRSETMPAVPTIALVTPSPTSTQATTDIIEYNSIDAQKYSVLQRYTRQTAAGGSEEEQNEKCRMFIEGDPEKNELYSPDYPNDYPKNINCTRIITAPKGQIIRLDFRNSFHIEEKEECKFDFLEIRDGQYGFSNLIGKYCGTDFPPEITSKERYLWMHFHSDESIEYSGFTAVYEFIDRNRDAPSTDLNCTIEKDGYEGFINSTDVPQEIRDTVIRNKIPLDCMWRIQVPEKWKIQVKFIDFKLSKPNDCETNFLDIFPEQTVMPLRVKNFCGSAGEGITSDSNILHMRFYAEQVAINSNFAILYTAFRDRGATSCVETEYDCEDATCIAAELKCNGRDNCKFRWDEEGCKTESEGQSEHMIIIITVFGLILGGMVITFLVNCIRKIMHDQKIIRDIPVLSDGIYHIDSFILDAPKTAIVVGLHDDNDDDNDYKFRYHMDDQHKGEFANENEFETSNTVRRAGDHYYNYYSQHHNNALQIEYAGNDDSDEHNYNEKDFHVDNNEYEDDDDDEENNDDESFSSLSNITIEEESRASSPFEVNEPLSVVEIKQEYCMASVTCDYYNFHNSFANDDFIILPQQSMDDIHCNIPTNMMIISQDKVTNASNNNNNTNELKNINSISIEESLSPLNSDSCKTTSPQPSLSS